MGSGIVQTDRIVTLVGAGPVNKEVLAIALTHAPFVVAVDGGAEMVRKCGGEANILLGDLDSVSKEVAAAFPANKRFQSNDQETTDLEKALMHTTAQIRIGVGFLGGRADHHMSAMREVARAAPGALILIGEDDVVFRCPAHLRMDIAKGTRVSLFPVGQARVDATCLRWPLRDVALDFATFVSQSNEVAQTHLDIHVMGQLIVVLPARFLPDVIRAVQPNAPDAALAK